MNLVRDGIPLVLSAITLWSQFLAGDKNPAAWFIALVNQALWLIWILAVGAYGLLPMNAGMWYISYRNWRLWTVDNTADDRALAWVQAAARTVWGWLLALWNMVLRRKDGGDGVTTEHNDPQGGGAGLQRSPPAGGAAAGDVQRG